MLACRKYSAVHCRTYLANLVGTSTLTGPVCIHILDIVSLICFQNVNLSHKIKRSTGSNCHTVLCTARYTQILLLAHISMVSDNLAQYAFAQHCILLFREFGRNVWLNINNSIQLCTAEYIWTKFLDWYQGMAHCSRISNQPFWAPHHSALVKRKKGNEISVAFNRTPQDMITWLAWPAYSLMAYWFYVRREREYCMLPHCYWMETLKKHKYKWKI